MGQAKKRREEIATYAPGRCNGCNLCCVIFEIPEIGKAPFVPCANLCSAGCSIHNSGSKPKTCVEFVCRYISVHELDLEEKAIIPHPKDAGAYVVEKGPRHLVVYVDPKQPRKWTHSGMPSYLKTMRQFGFSVAIIDRGYEFTPESDARIDSMVMADYVELAVGKGIKPTYPSSSI